MTENLLGTLQRSNSANKLCMERFSNNDKYKGNLRPHFYKIHALFTQYETKKEL
jgi:hypothetical protein